MARDPRIEVHLDSRAAETRQEQNPPLFRRLNALFLRYSIANLGTLKVHVPIAARGTEPVGYVESVFVSEGRLNVVGWAEAEEIQLRLGKVSATVKPQFKREDVTRANGVAQHVGFHVSIPVGPDALRPSARPSLIVRLAGTASDVIDLRLPRLLGPRRRVMMMSRFLVTMFTLTPAIVGWLISRDATYKARIKRGLGFVKRMTVGVLKEDVVLPGRDAPVASCPITIIVPVYNAFELMQECLNRVVTNTDLGWRMVVVEDCSTDERVRPYLREWVTLQASTGHEIELVENDRNLGFIRSVNTGFKRALEHGDHVVILNTDALVPESWAGRLLWPMIHGEKIATVTPFSNDAEIFSVPVICERGALKPGQSDALDRAARAVSPEGSTCEAPTGVGFCMAMNIDYLRSIPEFDTMFGRGYGEEVDWCQKARALGARHVSAANLFVEHRGGESFGSVDKIALVAKNNAINARRYPRFDNEVQEFIATDPLLTARLFLAVAWAAETSETPVPVFVAHTLGGGAEHYLQKRIEGELPAVVLRVGGETTWMVEVVTGTGAIRGVTDDRALVERLLAPLGKCHLVYSCGVGHPNPVEVPDFLVSLAERKDATVEVLFHDFFPLSPSYTLLDSYGRYYGPLEPGESDTAHEFKRPDGSILTLADWHAAWRPLLERADELRVFSEDSRVQVLSCFPDLENRVHVKPHRLNADIPVIVRVPKAVPVIGVLGNIGYQKGAGVLSDLSRQLARDGSAKLVLIGTLDPAYYLTPPAFVHGSYDIADIADIARDYGIDCWLIPSIWPETFSYAVHEALETGLPVMAFDIGAQGDAVEKAQNGIAMPFDPCGNHVQAVYTALKRINGQSSGNMNNE